MFRKVLIANRGEIACRVMRTAKAMALRTVAVYSDADANALHVAIADEAHRIGPPPARASYLDIDAIVAVAKRSGAEAVHPGYGFLSENATFAQACRDAGLVFVGPPPAAIRAMGSKSEAKALMEAAGVPVVPGYHGAAQDLATLEAAAKRIGYPVLIKATAGGGGKGMRIVARAEDLAAAVASAKREAESAFGDGRLLIEKYLDRPRHVEVQVFADRRGNVVYLFERDCSIQRRHQKVLEEAPAPGLSDDTRRRMGETAAAAARAVNYEGAGTVEFIMDRDGRFYFMEMNTRLQVEHPVTEMITGQDLVEWQFRVAAGEDLPLHQEQLTRSGCAVEVRLYAEDPARDFLPATGRLAHLRFPEPGPRVRIETGVRAGDAVSIHYDPMIAKLIAWGEDRGAALRRLRAILEDTQVAGLTTNLAFLAALAAHPAFAAGEVDTGFIDRHRAALIPARQPVSDRVLALASLGVLLALRADTVAAARASGDPWSPWSRLVGWRLNDDAWHVLQFRDGPREIEVKAHFRGEGFVLDLPGGSLAVRGTLDADGVLAADLGGTRLAATVVRRAAEVTVIAQGESHSLILHDPLAEAAGAAAGADGRLTAPMPGRIVAVQVEAGAAVKRGAPLLVLEAMKMEHTIAAPADGTVGRVLFAVGDQVNEGAQLIEFKTS